MGWRGGGAHLFGVAGGVSLGEEDAADEEGGAEAGGDGGEAEAGEEEAEEGLGEGLEGVLVGTCAWGGGSR